MDRLKYDEVAAREGMEPLRAMNLLAKATMGYIGVSAAYRTIAYYAGWEWLKVFNATDHPLAQSTRDMFFCEVIPLICPEFSQEDMDGFDVVSIDEAEEKAYIDEMEETEGLDPDTMYAIRHSYELLPA